MKKILLSSPLYKAGMEILEGQAEILIQKEHTKEGLMKELEDVDGYILRIGKIDGETIRQAKTLKVIARPGVGVDNVDVEEATREGIPVVICPSSNARAVAEHTLALLLGISKNLMVSCEENRRGNFNIRNAYKAVDIEGKTVTILGAGKIGMEFAKLCKGIGMRAVLYDPYVLAGEIQKKGFYPAESMECALEQGDYVSLHMPLNEKTREIIGQKEIERMKPTAFLINCARGELVEEKALYQALKERRLAGAGLDVLKEEPINKENPFLKLDNVMVTPHMAAQTQETTEKVVKLTAEGTLAVLRGEKWPYVCNPQVYEHEKWKNRLIK